MRISVVHSTEYHYDEPVHLDPHVFRLAPRQDGGQRVLRYGLELYPMPTGRSECLDQDGNLVTQAWFATPSDSLVVRSNLEVETLRENPFDFLLQGGDTRPLPMSYAEPLAGVLMPYRGAASEASRDLQEFGERISRESGGVGTVFLMNLTREIFQGWRSITRPVGAPHPAPVTLDSREGSCRDLAVLFCAACRAVGYAARFVSGYEREAAAGEAPYMHAWAEVYLEGGGWRGYDPSRGLAVGSGHVGVAAARDPALAGPISGCYRGSVPSRMSAAIAMQVY
jgi:transglutaminase-like putative cysteine protease